MASQLQMKPAMIKSSKDDVQRYQYSLIRVYLHIMLEIVNV